MTTHADLGPRILERLRACGYWRSGRAEVARFCSEKGYRPQYVYAWLKGRKPSYDNLTRLAADLGTTIGWMMFGLQGPTAGAGPPGPDLAVLETDGAEGVRRRPGRAGRARPARRQPAPRPGPPAQIFDFKRLLAVRASLEVLEAEMEAILRALPDRLVWFDGAGVVVGHSAGRAATSAGPDPTDKRLADLYPPDVAAALEDGHARAAATGDVVAVEYSVDAGTERRTYEARFVPLAAAASAAPRVLAIARDVTDLRRAERSARALLQVSHDVAGTLEPDELVQRILVRLVDMFGVRVAALYRAAPGSDDLVVERTAGSTSPEQWIGQTMRYGQGMVGRAATELRTICTPDFLADYGPEMPPWVHARAAAEGYRAVASVPLRGRQGLVGVLTIGREAGYVFAPADVALLEGFADQAAVALERARLYAETRALGERFRTLSELSGKVSSSLELDEVLHAIARAGARLMNAPLVSLTVADPGTGDLRVRAMSDPRYAAGDFRRVMPLGTGIVPQAAERRVPVSVPDVFQDPRNRNEGWWRQHGLRSCLAVPIVAPDDTLLGVLSVCGPRPFRLDASEESLLQIFAGQAAAAIRNARLYAESETRRHTAETLIGVGRVLSETLDGEAVARTIAEGVPGSLGAKTAGLFRLDARSGELVEVAHAGDVGPRSTEPIVYPAGTGLMSLAVAARRPIMSPNVLTDSRVTLTAEARARVERAAYRAALAVPLVVEDRVVGALSVGDHEGRVFSEDDVRVLGAFADQAAVAFEKARLFAEAERRRAEAEELARVASRLTEAADAQAVAERIVSGVLRLFAAQSSMLRRLEEDGSLVVVACGGRLAPHLPPGHVQRPGTGCYGRAVATGSPVASHDVLTDPSADLPPDIRRAAELAGDRAFLVVPLRTRGRTLGALSIGDGVPRDFSEDEVRLLQLFADQAALAIDHARLREALDAGG